MILFIFKLFFIFVVITVLSSLFSILKMVLRVKQGAKNRPSSASSTYSAANPKGDIEAEYRVIRKE